MKNLFKSLGIIVFVAIIGFSISACKLGDSTDSDNSGSGGGGSGSSGSLDRKITIQNNTSVDLYFCWIKPSTSTDWGGV